MTDRDYLPGGEAGGGLHEKSSRPPASESSWEAPDIGSGPNEGGGAWTMRNVGWVARDLSPEEERSRRADREGTYRGMAGSQAHGVAPTAEANVSAAYASGGQLQRYMVEEGDTLQAIASRFYGTAEEWERIAEANRDRLGDDYLLRPGQQLTIPGAEG